MQLGVVVAGLVFVIKFLSLGKNSSYLFPEEDLSSLLDSVQDEGLCQLDDHHLEGPRAIRTSMTSRPLSQGNDAISSFIPI